MSNQLHFATVGIPLSRPEIVDFLVPPEPESRGALVTIVGQRPSPTAEANWIKRLQETAVPTITDLLQIDDPHTHLVQRPTDRLVPVEFLAEPDFLTRPLGGWIANTFGVLGYTPQLANGDPLLERAESLHDFGDRNRFFGANPQQMAAQLGDETGQPVAETADAFCRLHTIRQPDAAIVHVDWGAARPLRPDEFTPADQQACLHQVRNIAFSFKHAPLVARIQQLHDELTGDDARLTILQAKARALSEP